MCLVSVLLQKNKWCSVFGRKDSGMCLILPWQGDFLGERGNLRVASCLIDFSESEEDLSSTDPEQEGLGRLVWIDRIFLFSFLCL